MTPTNPGRNPASGGATTPRFTPPRAVVPGSQFPFAADETARVAIEDDSLRISPVTERVDAERTE